MRTMKIKRFMATLLAMVMVMGIMPMNAFAGYVSNSAQIMQGNFTANDDTQTVTTNIGDAEKIIDNGMVTLSKTLEATGTPNNFNVELKVTTTQKVSENVSSPDAAVVLVMDESNSMDYCAECGSKMLHNKYGYECTNRKCNSTQNRMQAAKAGAINFVNRILADTPKNANETYAAKRYISLVRFADYSSVTCDWVDITTTYGYNQIINSINGLNTNGGTNLDAGLRNAIKQLNKNTIADFSNKFVVALTDGEPTFSTNYGTGSYCDANICNETAKTAASLRELANLYTICYGAEDTVCYSSRKYTVTVGDFLSSISSAWYSADNTVGLETSFGNISHLIQLLTEAWEVTDPMGQFINFGGVITGQGTAANFKNGVLTWNLKQDVPTSETKGDKTYYTYILKYSISLDTAAEGFEETVLNDNNRTVDKYYPTNGYTTLKYIYYNEKGQIVDANGTPYQDQEKANANIASFNIPGVKGTIPTVGYKINYWYKDREKGEYVIGDTDNGSGKLWSTVSISSDNYNKENYKFTKGNIGIQTLNADNMVFNLYYDPIPVNVIVNHYVSTVNKTDDGETYSEPELQYINTYENKYFKGDKFTAELLDDETYTKVSSLTVGNKTYTTDIHSGLVLDGNKTINIYYTKTGEDNRTPVDYEIHYFYRNDYWEINETTGKYEKVTGEYIENEGNKVTAQDFHGATVTAPNKSNGYTLDNLKTPSMQLKLDKTSTKNRLDVYYYKEAPKTPDAKTATLTIEHKYYQETVNGKQEVTEDNWTEYDNQTVYVGETWQATPDTKDDYLLKTIAEDFTVTITEANKDYHIVVEYYKDVRVPVEVVVNHYYTTYKWGITGYNTVENQVQKEVVDEITGETTTVTEIQTSQEPIYGYVIAKEDKLEGIHATGEHYVGQYYTPAKVPNGFTFDATNSDTAKALEAGTNTFNLYYVVYQGSEDDNADVTINHIYETYTSYIDANGNVVLNELTNTETVSEDTRYGLKGDVIQADKIEKEGFAFVKADTEDLKVILKGIDGQYNVYYRQDINNLGDKYTVNVQPIYKTYRTYINDAGETVTELAENGTENGALVPVEAQYYAGQTAVVMPSAFVGSDKVGFAYDPTDTDNTPNLSVLVSAEGENTINIVYKKVIDERGLPCIVTVNNVYTTVTKYVDNGEYKEDTQTITGSNTTYAPYYVGQIFTTTDKGTSQGFNVDTREDVTQPDETIKITGDTQVTFYWYQEIDHTVPATVQVIHHYTINDANPNAKTLTWTAGEDSILSGYYANQTYVAPYDFSNGKFTEDNVVEVVPSDAANAGITLSAGNNVIHIYYEKNIDTRSPSSVKVIHNYYASEAKLQEGVTEATYEENIDKMEADTYTATLRETNANLPYVFNSATPENYTLVVEKDKENNLITISYVRAQTTYTVTHNYYANGSFEGSQTTTGNGNVGDTITANSITKLTSYNGINYSYSNGSDDITLVLDAANNTITLRYDRYYSTGGGGGGSTTPTPDPDVDIEDPDVPLTEDPDLPEDETIIDEEDVPLTENPDLPEDETIIDEEDIPLIELPELPEDETIIDEEDVPLAETPDISSDETEIEDEEVPLANLPQTGMIAKEVDPSVTLGMMLMTIILLSAGFIYIMPRKSKDD